MGVFDGFHRGHQALLDHAVRVGESQGRPVAMVTFDPHPLAVLAPDQAPVQLLSVDERVELALDRGADHVLVLRFSPEMAATDPADFVQDLLVERLTCRHLVVGSNFRCGRGGTGDTDFLRDFGLRSGFRVDSLDLVRGSSGTCSSTAVRRALASGHVDAARELLGRDDLRILGLATSRQPVAQVV